MIAFTGALLVVLPTGAQAAVSGVDAISEVSGNTFTVIIEWTYTSYDNLELRLFHDNILIATDRGYSGFSGFDIGIVDFSPVQAGTYKIQLWSTTSNMQLYSKDWQVPQLQISLSVAPNSGQIGTTFVATTTFSSSSSAPDIYSFSGSLEVNAGATTFLQNVGGTIYSDHYYKFFDLTDYTIKPVFTATGFTFPTKGNYVISAQYTDSLTNISATSATVAMEDQYAPRLSQLEADLAQLESRSTQLETDLAQLTAQFNTEIVRLNSEITKTRNDLNSTKSDLADTKASLDATKADLAGTKNQLSMTSNNLNETDNSLTDAKKDLNDKIKSANNMAYAGIAVGVIGILFGLIGIVLARKKKDSTQVIAPTPVQYAQAPMQAPPPVQAPPPMVHQQAPTHVPPPQPMPAPMAQPQPAVQAPSGPVNCAKCGAPMPAGMRFCGNCGTAR
jgi:hypothetical protein